MRLTKASNFILYLPILFTKFPFSIFFHLNPSPPPPHLMVWILELKLGYWILSALSYSFSCICCFTVHRTLIIASPAHDSVHPFMARKTARPTISMESTFLALLALHRSASTSRDRAHAYTTAAHLTGRRHATIPSNIVSKINTNEQLMWPTRVEVWKYERRILGTDSRLSQSRKISLSWR